MSHRTTSWRGSRIWRRQTHSVSSPVARFWRNIARWATRRPCGWSSNRRVRRRSSRGRSRSTNRSASRSSAEVIRSKSRWRSSSPREYASGEIVTPSISPSSSLSEATWTPIVASSDIVASWPSPPSSAAAGLALLVALGVGHQALEPRLRQLPAAAPPELREHPVVDLAVVAPPHEQGGPRVPDDALVAEVDERQRPGEVDRRRHVDGEPRGPQGAPEADGLGQQPAPVDDLAGRRDGQGAGGLEAHVRPARSPRRGTGGRPPRAPAGCPPRT